MSQALPAGACVRIDQGYREDGHCYRGEDVRYRLPDLTTDPFGIAQEVYAVTIDAQSREQQPDVIRARALAPEEGWFELRLDVPWKETQILRIQLGQPGNAGTGPFASTVPLELDLTGSVILEGETMELAGRVPLRVVNPEIHWLRVLAPLFVEASNAFDVSITFMSGWSGPQSSSMVTQPAPGTLRVDWSTGSLTTDVRASALCDELQAVRLTIPGLPAGLHRLEAQWQGASQARGLSAPIRVGIEESQPKIFVGSLHNHTSMGGHASSTPRRALRYARDLARLDFFALTEHADAAQFDWKLLQELARTETRPQSFLMFAGFEWTHARAGHRHVLFLDADRGIPLSSTNTDLPAFTRAFHDDPNCLVVVHHSLWNGGSVQSGYDFGEPGSFPRQRLAEAYSWHGCSLDPEGPFRIQGDLRHQLPRELHTDLLSALRAGHDFWLNADSDGHLGLPGGLVGVEWPKGRRYAFQGITAVRCASLTKDSVFAALSRGDVYGTTGARMHLESQWLEGDELEVRIAATAPLALVALRTPDQILGRRDYPLVTPGEEHGDARLFLDPRQGQWDDVVRWSIPREQRASPLILEVAQQDWHCAWMRVPAMRR